MQLYIITTLFRGLSTILFFLIQTKKMPKAAMGVICNDGVNEGEKEAHSHPENNVVFRVHKCLPADKQNEKKSAAPEYHATDKISRMLFPLLYIVFCAVYFGYFLSKKGHNI